jgi:hypothetical protein
VIALHYFLKQTGHAIDSSSSTYNQNWLVTHNFPDLALPTLGPLLSRTGA